MWIKIEWGFPASERLTRVRKNNKVLIEDLEQEM